jgi:hypothetical protein
LAELTEELAFIQDLISRVKDATRSAESMARSSLYAKRP